MNRLRFFVAFACILGFVGCNQPPESSSVAEEPSEADSVAEDAPEQPSVQVAYVTTDSFQEDVLESDVPVLLDFTADWCVPCKIVDPIIESIAPDMEGRARVFKLDIDESPEIYRQYGVNGVPHILFFNNGVEQDRISSPQEREIYVEYLEAMIAGTSALDVTMKLLAQDDFRRHFILTKEIPHIDRAMQIHENLLSQNFENGQTPISLIINAPSIRQDDLIELALAQNPPLSAADLAGLGRCEEFEKVVAENPDLVNQLDPDGNAPLSTAMIRSYRLPDGDCVREVLDAGADVALAETSKSSFSRTVALYDDHTVLSELLQKGWDAERLDESGRNALHWAATYGDLDKAQILIDHGVNRSLQTGDGQTAAEIVQSVLERRKRTLEEQGDAIDPGYMESIKSAIADFETLVAILETRETG